jgi:hypothetical protein
MRLGAAFTIETNVEIKMNSGQIKKTFKNINEF